MQSPRILFSFAPCHCEILAKYFFEQNGQHTINLEIFMKYYQEPNILFVGKNTNIMPKQEHLIFILYKYAANLIFLLFNLEYFSIYCMAHFANQSPEEVWFCMHTTGVFLAHQGTVNLEIVVVVILLVIKTMYLSIS